MSETNRAACGECGEHDAAIYYYCHLDDVLDRDDAGDDAPVTGRILCSACTWIAPVEVADLARVEWRRGAWRVAGRVVE